MARRVRCRSGTSTSGPRRSRPLSSRRSSTAGGSVRTRAATSSIASGRPSSAAHHLGDGRGGGVVQREVRIGLRGRGRRTAGRRVPRPPLAAAVARPGHAERTERDVVLAAQPQQAAAGHQQLRARAAGEQPAELGRGAQHLLEVVDDAAARAGRRAGRRPGPAPASALDRDADRGGDRAGHVRRVPHRLRGPPATRRPARRPAPARPRAPAGSCRSRPARSPSPAARRGPAAAR